jgi:dipeptidase E
MKFYLSSYKLGYETNRLVELVKDKHAVYISNALDFSENLEKRKATETDDIETLSKLGFVVKHLDLRFYFDNRAGLRNALSGVGLIWVSGGCTFTLRQAMKLSGFDLLMMNELRGDDLVYGGYSAGICVLAPSLKGLDKYALESAFLSGSPDFAKPYGEMEIIWEGLGAVSYWIVPHFDSDHPESSEAGKYAEFLTRNHMPFKTLRNGEVIIIE